MRQKKSTFDPLYRREGANPPFPTLEPFPIDIAQLIGQTVYLDPRRIKLPSDTTHLETFDGLSELARALTVFGQETVVRVHPIANPDYDAVVEIGKHVVYAARRARVMVRVEVCTDQDQGASLLETINTVARFLEAGHTEQGIAKRMGKTSEWVRKRIQLATLDTRILALFAPAQDEPSKHNGRRPRRLTPLPLDLGLLLVELPVEQHQSGWTLGLAQRVARGALSVAGAKKKVHQQLHPADESLRSGSPTTLFGMLERQLKQLLTTLDVIAAMDPAAQMRMFSTRDPRAVRTLVTNRLEVVISQVSELGRRICGENWGLSLTGRKVSLEHHDPTKRP